MNKQDYTIIPCILNKDEIMILSAFDHHGELVIPEHAFKTQLTRAQIHRVLDNLTKKHLISQTKPLKLTKLGKKTREFYNKLELE